MAWLVVVAISGFLCFRISKSKGLNVALWTAAGVLFGPVVLVFLLIKKKSSGPSNGQSLTDQAVEGIRTIRYSVDNAASKIGGTDAFKSGSKIASELRSIFRKR
jgi:hypothetical protein